MFKVLSLDGGGIRGAFIAAFLSKLQENLDQPLIRYFDLISGTSTGGLIAVALGMGLDAETIRQLYEDDGGRIFTRSPTQLSSAKRYFLDKFLKYFSLPLDAEWLFRSKFTSRPLREILDSTLQDRRLGESQIRLAIPAVDLTVARIIVFKTPHRPNFVRDRHYRATDVIMATTAAPSYFESASIEPGSLYCDGGVWANNPALVGYVEAVKISQECRRPDIDEPFGASDIRLLSVGTGRASYFARAESDSFGLKWWAPRIFNISSESQSEGIHGQMQYLLGSQYVRINFDMGEGNWALDSIGNISAMIHLGSDLATQKFGDLRPMFFSRCCPSYTAFD